MRSSTAHRARTSSSVPSWFDGAAHRVERFFQRLLPALLAAGPGMEHDPPPAHRLDGGAALQNIVDAAQALFFFQAGHADVIGRVHRKGDALFRARRAEHGRAPGADAHAAAALVLKRREAERGRVSRDIRRRFAGVAVRKAGRAEARSAVGLIHTFSHLFHSSAAKTAFPGPPSFMLLRKTPRKFLP